MYLFGQFLLLACASLLAGNSNNRMMDGLWCGCQMRLRCSPLAAGEEMEKDTKMMSLGMDQESGGRRHLPTVDLFVTRRGG
jgi:hypothetical protein